MKSILSILLFIGFSASGQIVFDKIVHDFGIIREDGTPVEFQFYFNNNYDHELELKSVQPGCGCTVANFEKKIIPAKSRSWITLQYNPKGRPGYFLKPAEIIFQHGDESYVRNIAVKGFTGNYQSEQFLQKETGQLSIEIAPLLHSIKYSDRWNVHHNERFQTFVNDITFVIDQYDFVELTIELGLADTAKLNQYLDELTVFKQLFKKELIKRNYPEFSVGFVFKTDLLQSDSPEEKLGVLSVYPQDFVNHLIDESIILDTSEVVVDEGPIGIKRRMIHYMDIMPDTKFSKTLEYERFIKRAVRSYMSHGQFWYGLNTYTSTEVELKQLNKIQKQLRKSLLAEGLEEEFIHQMPLDTLMDDLKVIRLAEYLPPAEKDTTEKQIDSLLFYQLFSSKTTSEYLETDGQVVQNLPAYFQQIKNYVKRVDTTNVHFIQMMDQIIDFIKDGKKIELVMESSASKAPAQVDVDNIYVARIRAKESKEIIRKYMMDRGLHAEDIVFKETIPLISGPEYDVMHYLPQYYYYFQYLKLIPVYKVPEKQFSIPPYKVHMVKNSVDIMDDSRIFQSFLDKIALRIQEQGYVKLVIESSSSKVPTSYKIGKNEHLSYHRAQQAKNKIYEGVKARGFNPSKVIIVEERILVQGPEYKRSMDPEDEQFKPFQYIKVLTADQIFEKQ